MTKMTIRFAAAALVLFISFADALNNDRRFNNVRYNPYNNAALNNNNNNNYNHNNNNRDYYNNRYYTRQYYDNYLKNFKSDVVASPQARIVSQEVQTPDNGEYTYSYDTENGIHADEHRISVPLAKNTDERKEVVTGSYSFVTPEGLHVHVRYTADENGFHPTITYGGVESSVYARRAQPAGVVVTKSN